MQELLLLIGGRICAISPKLYGLGQGLIDFKRTARPVLPHSAAALAVEVVIVHCALDVADYFKDKINLLELGLRTRA